MNIRPLGETQVYRYADLTFSGNSIYEMLCDKLSVLSHKKICRRVKDLYDVYVLSSICDFEMPKIINAWQVETRVLGEPIFVYDMASLKDLKHAYDKYKGIGNKPNFDVVYERVLLFSTPIFEKVALKSNTFWSKWDCKELYWR